MAYITLKTNVRENIAYITLARPERLNSFDLKLGQELHEALSDFSSKNPWFWFFSSFMRGLPN